MSGLHQAVARAIADAWAADALRPVDELAAEAAIGVCFAEAQRAVERGALGADLSKHEPGLVVALAVLAALAEEQRAG